MFTSLPDVGTPDKVNEGFDEGDDEETADGASVGVADDEG